MEHGQSSHQLKLNELAVNELRRLWKGAHTVIVDEISMVSYKVLLAIHQRLCEIFATMTYLEALMLLLLGIFTNSPQSMGITYSALVEHNQKGSHGICGKISLND